MKFSYLLPLLPLLEVAPCSLLPSEAGPPTPDITVKALVLTQPTSCQKQDVETLTARLLQDLPSYANRASQSARFSRTTDIYSYVLVAGRPEFAPLTLGPGIYSPDPATGTQQPQQVFITTLERQYTAGKPVELQQYHWLFLTQTSNGWQLAMMFSRIGTYPAGRPPTPPRDTSSGVIAQAVRAWLRDCAARS